MKLVFGAFKKAMLG